MTDFLDNASYAFLCLLSITILSFIAGLNIWWHKEWKNMTPEQRQALLDEQRNQGDWQ